ncbi:hypothetical protein B0H10DRAFT_2244874 [Mycena sp. CBHHK59/15]|nr:hypothetical protein B0H10DRAFT_2244874 [Mycena sp. CBHHK59/15]
MRTTSSAVEMRSTCVDPIALHVNGEHGFPHPSLSSSRPPGKRLPPATLPSPTFVCPDGLVYFGCAALPYAYPAHSRDIAHPPSSKLRLLSFHLRLAHASYAIYAASLHASSVPEIQDDALRWFCTTHRKRFYEGGTILERLRRGCGVAVSVATRCAAGGVANAQGGQSLVWSGASARPLDVLDNISPPAQRDEISESGSAEEDFIPSDHDMDSEDEAEGEAEEDEGWRGRSSKPAKSSRTDVPPLWQGETGAKANSNAKPKGKKPKLGKRAGLATKKRAASSASGRSSNITTPNDDFDAPMSQYGGPAMDDDENEQLEHPAQAGKGKKKGLPTDTGHKFVPVPLRRPTKKELRAQDVVNRVWKPEEGEPPFVHEVTEDGPWWGLLQYRSNDWRNGFLRQSHKGMKLLHNSPQSDDESDQDEQPNQDDAAASESNGPTAAAVKPQAFKFDTPEGIAGFWGDGKVKKGFFLSYLIVYAYAYYLSILESIPPEYECSKDRPYGALLLAHPHIILGGVRPSPLANGRKPFSDDNWGDIRTRLSKTKTTHTRRATKFLHILKSWDGAHWDALHTAATEWLDKKKQAGSSSCGTSEAGEMDETEDDEPEIIVLSD